MQHVQRAKTLAVSVMMVGAGLLACKKKQAPTVEASPLATPTPSPASPALDLPPTPTNKGKLGEAMVLDGVTVTVEEQKNCTFANAYSRRSLASRKQKLVGIKVLFEGNGERAHVISYSAFKATDPEGITFRSNTRAGTDCDPTLKSNTLSKGDKTRGWVLFEVPLTVSKLSFPYTNRRPPRAGTPPNEREQIVKFELD